MQHLRDISTFVCKWTIFGIFKKKLNPESNENVVRFVLFIYLMNQALGSLQPQCFVVNN